MSKEFKLSTDYIPCIGIGLGYDKSSRYRGIVLILPFISVSFQIKLKDDNELS
jgi:hypothetical protein